MDVQHHACDPHKIEQFLSDQLGPREQAALEAHLEACAACRETLESLTADVSWWREARDHLSNPSSAADSSATATAPWLAYSDEAEERGSLIVHGLKSYLAPTDDPRMLGRVGPYEIAGIIGSGGMGIVLKGFDAALNRYVAVKLLAPRLAASAAARRRFAREAQAAAAVMHDNVMAIHAVAEAQGLPYFVMPYARGSSLEKRIRQTGPLGLEEVLRIGLQVAAGLAAAHAQGLVHRDIKPANILLEEGTERVKITDFGLARAADDASLTRSGVIAGTPQYMSPEQARGEAIDHRTDLFSLGSVLYEMSTGRAPFRAESPYGVLRRICETEARPVREINPSLPVWLARIIGRLHEKEPGRRYDSASDVAALLEQCLGHVRQPASIELPPELLAADIPPARRWKTQSIVGGVSVLTCIAAAVAITVGLMRGPRTNHDAELVQGTGSDERDVETAGNGQREAPAPLAHQVARRKRAGRSLWNDGIAERIGQAESDAQRLTIESAEASPDEFIKAELERIDDGLRILEADVLESVRGQAPTEENQQ
jgi:eukaryotic-like serine/threonine-protein kinase